MVILHREPVTQYLRLCNQFELKNHYETLLDMEEEMSVELPLETLRSLYPYPDFEFESQTYARDGKRRSFYRVLMLFLLSAGTQDRILVDVCRRLFKAFPHPEDIINPDNSDAILETIKPSGLQIRKLEHIKSAASYCAYSLSKQGTARSVCADISDNPTKLWQIRGVGGKVFECVMGYACGKPALPLDSNVMRVVRRTCFEARDEVKDMDYVSARKKLKSALDPDEWIDTHEILRLHGIAVCRMADPKCQICPVLSCQFRKMSFDKDNGVTKVRQKAKAILTNEWEPWRELLCEPKSV